MQDRLTKFFDLKNINPHYYRHAAAVDKRAVPYANNAHRLEAEQAFDEYDPQANV